MARGFLHSEAENEDDHSIHNQDAVDEEEDDEVPDFAELNVTLRVQQYANWRTCVAILCMHWLEVFLMIYMNLVLLLVFVPTEIQANSPLATVHSCPNTSPTLPPSNADGIQLASDHNNEFGQRINHSSSQTNLSEDSTGQNFLRGEAAQNDPPLEGPAETNERPTTSGSGPTEIEEDVNNEHSVRIDIPALMLAAGGGNLEAASGGGVETASGGEMPPKANISENRDRPPDSVPDVLAMNASGQDTEATQGTPPQVPKDAGMGLPKAAPS